MTVSVFPVPGSRVSGSFGPGLRAAVAFPAPISQTPGSPRSRSRANGGEIAAPAILVGVLLLLALVVAPERPQVQEAICQRHNGVEACRVW